MLFAILLAWSAIVLNAGAELHVYLQPHLRHGGLFDLAWLVYKVTALHKYKGVSLVIIIITGCFVSPFLAFS